MCSFCVLLGSLKRQGHTLRRTSRYVRTTTAWLRICETDGAQQSSLHRPNDTYIRRYVLQSWVVCKAGGWLGWVGLAGILGPQSSSLGPSIRRWKPVRRNELSPVNDDDVLDYSPPCLLLHSYNFSFSFFFLTNSYNLSIVSYLYSIYYPIYILSYITQSFKNVVSLVLAQSQEMPEFTAFTKKNFLGTWGF